MTSGPHSREAHRGSVADATRRGAPGTKRPGRTSDPQGNFGVGLWIVRRNVEALRGRVQARNRPGGGLEVSLELPLR